MDYQVTTDSTAESVTRSELMDFVNYTASDRDALFDSLITAARQRVEDWEWRAHRTQTVTLTLDAFPANNAAIYCPRPPLQSITTLKYISSTGSTYTTLSSTAYRVDTNAEPGRVTPAYGLSWPVSKQVTKAVEVTLVAGSTAAAKVPGQTKLAIKQLASHFFFHRDAVSEIRLTEAPLSCTSLLRPVYNERVLM